MRLREEILSTPQLPTTASHKWKCNPDRQEIVYAALDEAVRYHGGIITTKLLYQSAGLNATLIRSIEKTIVADQGLLRPMTEPELVEYLRKKSANNKFNSIWHIKREIRMHRTKYFVVTEKGRRYYDKVGRMYNAFPWLLTKQTICKLQKKEKSSYIGKLDYCYY